jgi:hypothetical protein
MSHHHEGGCVTNVFDQGAIDKIKEGSGAKDAASDVVAFVGLCRSKWEQCINQSGVREADLERTALVAPRVFSIVSQREQRQTTPTGEGFTRVRRAWALPERAYDQCRRAIGYLRHTEGDMEEIAPNFRRNPGNTKPRATATTPAAAAPSTPSAPTVATAPVGCALREAPRRLTLTLTTEGKTTTGCVVTGSQGASRCPCERTFGSAVTRDVYRAARRVRQCCALANPGGPDRDAGRVFGRRDVASESR